MNFASKQNVTLVTFYATIRKKLEQIELLLFKNFGNPHAIILKSGGIYVENSSRFYVKRFILLENLFMRNRVDFRHPLFLMQENLEHILEIPKLYLLNNEMCK